MRVLYLPLFNSSNLHYCSSTFSSLIWMKELVEKYKNALIYIVVPQGMKGQDIFNHPNFKIIPSDIWRQRQQFEMRYIPPEVSQFWDSGENFLDIVVTDKIPSMAYLRGNLSGLTGCTGGQTEKLHVSLAQFLLNKRDHGYVDNEILINQYEGMVHSDLVIYTSKSQLMKSMPEMTLYVSGSLAFETKKKCYQLLPLGDFSKFLGLDLPKDKEPIIMNFAVGMTADYNICELFDIMDKVYCGGRKVQLQINTSSSTETIWEQANRIPEKYAHCVWTRDLPYDEWIECLKKGHVFMYSVVKGGDISSTIIIQQLLRQVGVFENSSMTYDYVPTDYPFIYRNKEEAAVILRHVIDNYFSKEVQSVIDKQIKFIVERYSTQFNAEALVNLMVTKLIEKKKRTEGAISYRLLKEYVLGKNLISWKELVKFIKESTEKGLVINRETGRYGRSPGVWRDAMLLLGFADIGGEGGTLFQRYGDSIEDLQNLHIL